MSVKFQVGDRVVVTKGDCGFPYKIGDVGRIKIHRGEIGVDVTFLDMSCYCIENYKLELYRPNKINQYNIDFAKKYYENWLILRNEIIKNNMNIFATREIIVEQVGFTEEAVVGCIMDKLKINRNNDNVFNVILQGIDNNKDFGKLVLELEELL